MSIPFWQTNPDAPFATLVGVIDGACQPEARAAGDDDWDPYADLQRIARDHPDTPEMIRFKEELRTVIRDPSQIPRAELWDAAQYDDGSAEKFLARLWRDLYPDEPLP